MIFEHDLLFYIDIIVDTASAFPKSEVFPSPCFYSDLYTYLTPSNLTNVNCDYIISYIYSKKENFIDSVDKSKWNI